MNIAIVKSYSKTEGKHGLRWRAEIRNIVAFLKEEGHVVTYEDPTCNMAEDVPASKDPEFATFRATHIFQTIDWGRYDLLLCYDLGAVQLLSMLGHKAWWLSHILWNLPGDNEAKKIKAFARFAHRIIAPTAAIYGLLQEFPVPSVYAPWPFKAEAKARYERGDNIVWVGRSSIGSVKRIDRLAEVAKRLPKKRFDVYLADNQPEEPLPSNCILHIGENAADAIASAGVLLSTSEYETIGLIFLEAGFTGTPIVAWKSFGSLEYGPHMFTVKDETHAVAAIHAANKVKGDLLRIDRQLWFFEAKWGFQGQAGQYWRELLADAERGEA